MTTQLSKAKKIEESLRQELDSLRKLDQQRQVEELRPLEEANIKLEMKAKTLEDRNAQLEQRITEL